MLGQSTSEVILRDEELEAELFEAIREVVKPNRPAAEWNSTLLVGSGLGLLLSIAILVVVLLVERRLSRIQRLLELQLKWIETQCRSGHLSQPMAPRAGDEPVRAAPPNRPR
jgi:hypothetical protein